MLQHQLSAGIACPVVEMGAAKRSRLLELINGTNRGYSSVANGSDDECLARADEFERADWCIYACLRRQIRLLIHTQTHNAQGRSDHLAERSMATEVWSREGMMLGGCRSASAGSAALRCDNPLAREEWTYPCKTSYRIEPQSTSSRCISLGRR